MIMIKTAMQKVAFLGRLVVGRSTHDREVASSTPGLCTIG